MDAGIPIIRFGRLRDRVAPYRHLQAFSETKVLVLSVSVTEEQHAELKEMLDVMWKRRRYSYNYIGLCLAYFHVVWKQEGCY